MRYHKLKQIVKQILNKKEKVAKPLHNIITILPYNKKGGKVCHKK